MNPLSWADLGVGLAAVVANAFIVLAFLKFLGNHLSKLTASIDALERRCERVENSLDLMRAEFRGRMQGSSRVTNG